MHERYAQKQITEIWNDESKLANWQAVELAVIHANCQLGKFPDDTFSKISGILFNNAIDISWWKTRDEEVGHDLNAFLDERLRFIPQELQQYFHKNMTSYDTEEPAFANTLKESLKLVNITSSILETTLVNLAKKHRFTIMNGRTHGQEAKLQSFGKRCLTWQSDCYENDQNLQSAALNLKFNKLSGAIGNYGQIDPKIEKDALEKLGFVPFYGATQIMPRILYVPIAEALCQIVQTYDKIATDIRLGARSGRPIFAEPFGKKQKGSSAMPHKKNTIKTEQIEGMARMAKGYLSMIMDNIKTWEERAIEQSCVERVAWPDLFHIVIHSAKTLDSVLSGLVVYSDNMLQEIIESRGCYASDEAKELLKELGEPLSLTSEDAYRIVQLAAFNVFEISGDRRIFRDAIADSLDEANRLLTGFKLLILPVHGDDLFPVNNTIYSIQTFIVNDLLRVSPQLGASAQEVERWNKTLNQIFQSMENVERWEEIFKPSFLLKNEAKLYQEILGE